MGIVMVLRLWGFIAIQRDMEKGAVTFYPVPKGMVYYLAITYGEILMYLKCPIQ